MMNRFCETPVFFMNQFARAIDEALSPEGQRAERARGDVVLPVELSLVRIRLAAVSRDPRIKLVFHRAVQPRNPIRQL